MSVERVARKDGSVVWRVRWRQAGQNRSKVLGRKRDAEAFDAELRRKRRTGELAALDAGKETLAEFGEEWWKLYAEPNLAASTLKVYAILWDTHVLPRLGSLLDVATTDGDFHVCVEYDRTQRVDKNYDKFRRYNALLTVWWRATGLVWPFLVFVCQDAEHRRRFLHAADHELTGCLSAGAGADRDERHFARDRALFVLESDIRDGNPEAMQLPELPPRHEDRTNPASVRRIALPGLDG